MCGCQGNNLSYTSRAPRSGFGAFLMRALKQHLFGGIRRSHLNCLSVTENSYNEDWTSDSHRTGFPLVSGIRRTRDVFGIRQGSAIDVQQRICCCGAGFSKTYCMNKIL